MSSLQFTGATSSPFTIPNTDFTFNQFNMNGSVTLGGSTAINYLNLKGGATLAGIGAANGVFAYKDSALAFFLELTPQFPSPFENVRPALPYRLYHP